MEQKELEPLRKYKGQWADQNGGGIDNPDNRAYNLLVDHVLRLEKQVKVHQQFLDYRKNISQGVGKKRWTADELREKYMEGSEVSVEKFLDRLENNN